MQITLDHPDTQIYLKSYKPDQYIELNNQKIEHSIIVSPDQILAKDTLPRTFNDLKKEDIEAFLSRDYDIYLLGTGTSLIIPDQALLKIAQKKGKSLDFMDTNAACRTFNILASEHRHVAAFLILG